MEKKKDYKKKIWRMSSMSWRKLLELERAFDVWKQAVVFDR